MDDEKVYIVILNWNSWRYTIECLESVFRSRGVHVRVIVCDNSSQDGSLERIKAWAEGRLQVELPESNPLRRLSSPPIEKPISYVEYSDESPFCAESPGDTSPLILIQTGANLGFAGGTNVGLRYALTRDDWQYVWLLNNDTVVEDNTLSEMVAVVRETSNPGICGSTILYYDAPNTVLALGGAIFSRLTTRVKTIEGRSRFEYRDELRSIVESEMSYVLGASMLVTRAFLNEVGLLDEDYFLYLEEMDWAARAERTRFQLVYAPKSRVYHREGGSTGAGGLNKKKNFKADFYSFRSRLLFTWRFAPYALPIVGPLVALAIGERVLRRRWRSRDIVPTLREFVAWKARI